MTSELVGGGVALALALVFGFVHRADRRNGIRALEERDEALELVEELEAEVVRLLRAPISGRSAADYLERLRRDG